MEVKRLRRESSLRVTRPRVNTDRIWVSSCGAHTEQPIPSKHSCSYFLSNCLPGSKYTGRKFPLSSTAAPQLQVAQFPRICSLISFFVCFCNAENSHVGLLPPLLIWLQSALWALGEVSLTHNSPHLTGFRSGNFFPGTSSEFTPAFRLQEHLHEHRHGWQLPSLVWMVPKSILIGLTASLTLSSVASALLLKAILKANLSVTPKLTLVSSHYFPGRAHSNCVWPTLYPTSVLVPPLQAHRSHSLWSWPTYLTSNHNKSWVICIRKELPSMLVGIHKNSVHCGQKLATTQIPIHRQRTEQIVVRLYGGMSPSH